MRKLLEEKLDSFEKFEVLRRLWLRRDEVWTTLNLSEGLLIPSDVLSKILAELRAHGLVEKEKSTGRYNAKTSGPDAPGVTAILTIYAQDPLVLLQLLNELALRRLRGLTARKFADAFVVSRRKEPGDG